MLKTIKALALAGAMLPLAWTAGAQAPGAGTFVEVAGGRLWTQSCGAGPQAMVLLHDGMLHSVGWDDVWPALCQRFHVVRYDRRGYGRSPQAKAAYSEVEDVAAVMKAAGMDRAVIVGASHGGGVAIDFTLAHPDQVDRLVVVGPQVSGLAYSQHFQDRLAEEAGRMAKGDVLGAIKGSWVFAPGDDANAARLLKLLMASPQDLNRQGDPATPPPPAAPRLATIKAPTLVLVGEADVADNQGQAEVVEYAVPGARRVVVRGAGHMLYMEQPAQFADLVTRFASPVEVAASPGTEEALRRVIGEMQAGAPDYSRMSPKIADVTRQQLGAIKGLFARLGALKSLTFQSRSERGADVFLAVFEKGRAEWRIVVGDGGRIDVLVFAPMP